MLLNEPLSFVRSDVWSLVNDRDGICMYNGVDGSIGDAVDSVIY
jgi:hypothetical protein